MFFNRFSAVVCCVIIFSSHAFSQPKELRLKFGDIKPEDFKPQAYAIDSSTDAVYLDHNGSVHYEGNNTGWFSVNFQVHDKIRLLKKNSFQQLATVKIPLYTNGSNKEKLENLSAATFNLEDGRVVETDVDKSAIFEDKAGSYEIVKFTFPDLKEGSIIEFSYTTISPFFQRIPGWRFQGTFPMLQSQFVLEEPEFFDFAIVPQGYLKPEIDTIILTRANFNVVEPDLLRTTQNYSFNSNIVKHIWSYENIPALTEESYITDLDNYMQGLEFQFSAIRFPNIAPQTFLRDWYQTADQLMKNQYFGQGLNENREWLKDDLKSITNGETDSGKKARDIFYYIQSNYFCTNHSAIFLSQALKKTEQTKRGNVSDINMLLIAMLRCAGFNADPVLLSTREHGKTYDMYPILSKFNYVIARVEINKTAYLLDASQPNIGFGKLYKNCFNGHARIISSNPYIIDLSADVLKETEVSTLFLMNDSSGRISGSYKCTMGDIQSESMREKAKEADKNDYFNNIKKVFSFDVNLSNEAIDSLNNLEMPVSVQYDIDFKFNNDLVYFNPLIFTDAVMENPFKSEVRNYPVEMPYCIDKTYVISMQVPQNYKVDELPMPARVTLNNDDGIFEYLTQDSNGSIQMLCRLKLNKATFEPDDYKTLRDFFASIAAKESEEIVFKKIN